MTVDPRVVADRLAVIRHRIEAVVGGGRAADVAVLAVTKTFGADAIAGSTSGRYSSPWALSVVSASSAGRSAAASTT